MKVYADVMSIGLLHDTPARADVTCVTVGLEGHTRGRLAELGLRPGARLRVLSRKTLGGLHTDLSARVLGHSGEPVPGLYAAGEVAGFGGGGLHGYRALEGTFLGGCLFTGRTAGRALAAALR